MMALRTKGSGRKRSVPLEEVGEVRHFGKAQAVGNLGDAPAGLPEQDFGFLRDPAADEVGGGAAGVFFESLLKFTDKVSNAG